MGGCIKNDHLNEKRGNNHSNLHRKENSPSSQHIRRFWTKWIIKNPKGGKGIVKSCVTRPMALFTLISSREHQMWTHREQRGGDVSVSHSPVQQQNLSYEASPPEVRQNGRK